MRSSDWPKCPLRGPLNYYWPRHFVPLLLPWLPCRWGASHHLAGLALSACSCALSTPLRFSPSLRWFVALCFTLFAYLSAWGCPLGHSLMLQVMDTLEGELPVQVIVRTLGRKPGLRDTNFQVRPLAGISAFPEFGGGMSLWLRAFETAFPPCRNFPKCWAGVHCGLFQTVDEQGRLLSRRRVL